MKIPGILKPSKKKIIALVVLIIIAIVAFNMFFKPKEQSLQFAEVKMQDISSLVSSSGTLTGKNVVDLKFKSGGKLAYINVKVGDKVTKGQVIAGLDTQQLNIDLQQAQNTYRDKQAAAEKAEDDVKDNDDDESFAQKVTRTTAQAARDSAYDGVKEAQRAFQDAVIIAPISGVITQASPIPGQIVSSETIAQVADFSSLIFDTDIDESDIGKISLGQKARVTLDAYPDKELIGEVSEIVPQTKTTASGATVISVKINLGSPEITPVKGLSGQASIILAEVKNALTIPLEALREDNTVVIQTPQGLKAQEVTAGISSDTEVEIKEGLSENDKVLLNPPANGNFNQNRSSNPLNNITRFFGGGNNRARFGGTGGPR